MCVDVCVRVRVCALRTMEAGETHSLADAQEGKLGTSEAPDYI